MVSCQGEVKIIVPQHHDDTVGFGTYECLFVVRWILKRGCESFMVVNVTLHVSVRDRVLDWSLNRERPLDYFISKAELICGVIFFSEQTNF